MFNFLMLQFLAIPLTMAIGKLGVVDPTSYSNPNEIAVTSISLFLDVDFGRKILTGRAELDIHRKTDNATNLILDSKDLKIKTVKSDTNSALNFTLSESYKIFGSALNISIPDSATNRVIIEYETSPSASGLQWLAPEQTLGKKEPYLFSQFQPSHARSVLPCQDTPGVKFPYKAEITAAENLTVLMSALRVEDPKSVGGNRKLTKLHQPVPIPSYLIAIAVGRLAGQRLSDQISVWAEPETLRAAAYEFAEAQKMLDAAIDLCGPYEWTIYDILVMPPSFPFGGMENPCLTFVTPTVLAGDRSLVDVIAHEISHSWSGNLVTTKTFEHFWLNEGWTMFIERKISEKLHGTAERHFHAIQGLESLKETVEKTLGPDSEFTKLVPSLIDTDPDDAFSVVPYEKGHSFLFYLEQLVGGADKFNPFIKSYFANFRNTAIASDDFKNYFVNYFKENQNILKIDWDNWLFSKGMPIVIPQYETTLSDASVSLANEWRNGTSSRSANDLKSMTSGQISLFLARLLEESALPAESVSRMDQLYALSEMKNSEIRFRWLRLGLKAHIKSFVPKALAFINEQGRMKYVRPIYRDLYAWEEVREQAIENYKKNKGAMMFVLSNQLRRDLHLTE